MRIGCTEIWIATSTLSIAIFSGCSHTKYAPSVERKKEDGSFYRLDNNGALVQTVVYSCAENKGGAIDIPVGHRLVFDMDGDEVCDGCEPGDHDCECVNCVLAVLQVDGYESYRRPRSPSDAEGENTSTE